MATNLSRSIYLGADGQLAVQGVIERYKPTYSQTLVQVKYSGVNLLDQKGFFFGMHSLITGYEFSGIVLETGPTSPFKPGDAVFGMTRAGPGRPPCFGAHQDLVIADARTTFQLPPALDLKGAAVVSLVAHTAIDGLFNCLTYGFPAAKLGGADPRGQPILIWGGGSSVGLAAIQIAKAAGFSPIFATASPKNHDILKRLGATECFDYKSPTVVDDIRKAAATAGVKLATIFDSVSVGAFGPHADVETSSPALARRCCSDEVTEEGLRLASTGPVPADPAYSFCLSYRPYGDVDFAGNHQDPEWPIRARRAMEYFVGGDVDPIVMPNITAVKGAEAGIREIQRVSQGNVTLEKVAVEHPL
ncbi:chaperonin 10-like protein [Ilyonectria sp. MPI-CAGE-AT-0026]|nr:chaperonin 10-like protein [Ilyonectria sp. MPI-CAGE-AT-0026]